MHARPTRSLYLSIALTGCLLSFGGCGSDAKDDAGEVERVQSASDTTSAGARSFAVDWPTRTMPGNLLLLVAHVAWNDTAGPIGVPPGWVLIDRSDSRGFRMVSVALYYWENAPAQEGAVEVTAQDPEDRIKIALAEYAGLRTTNALDASATAVGESDRPESGTAFPSESGELWVAAIASDVGELCAPTNGFSRFESSRSGASALSVFDRLATDAGPASVATEVRFIDCELGSLNATPYAGVIATFRR